MANLPQMHCELIFTNVEQKNCLFSDWKVPVGKGEIEEKKFNLKGKLGLLILKKWFYCKQKPKTFKNKIKIEKKF